MEEKKFICPICGHKVESDGYCYEDGHIHYHCVNCSWSCNDSEIYKHKRFAVWVDGFVEEGFDEEKEAIDYAKEVINNGDYDNQVQVVNNEENCVVYTNITCEEEKPTISDADKVADMIGQFVWDNHISIKEAIKGCNIAIEQLGDSQ